MKGKCIVTLACVLAVSSCATLEVKFAEQDVERAVELINSQDVDLLARNSGKAFIFDGEILLRSSDVRAVWSSLAKNDFSLENPIIVETQKTNDATYAVFSDSEEMKIFFSKYIPAGSTLGKVETSNGAYQLLLGRRSEGIPTILGITGF
jgi:hypothetical protein